MHRCVFLILPSCHTIRLSTLCTLSYYLLALHTLLYLLLFVTTMLLSVIWRHIFHVSLVSVKLQTYGITTSPSKMCAEMWKFPDIVNMFKFDIHTTVFLKTRVFSFTATCTIANYSLSQLANNWRLQRLVQVQVVLPHQARSSTTRFAHINPLAALTMSHDA